MSRVLYSGDDQITKSYAQHCASVEAGIGWAKGVDVVKYKSQLDKITAHTTGTVIKVMTGMKNGQLDPEGFGYGNYVIILHGNNMATLYAHMDSVSVKMGAAVSKGEIIGTMGNTGNSFGAHLHFEVRRYNSSPVSRSLNDLSTFQWLDSEFYLTRDLNSEPTVTPAVTDVTEDNYIDNTIPNRFKVKVVETQKGAYTSYNNAVAAAKKVKGYVVDSSTNKIIFRSKTLTENSYADYIGSTKRTYKVRATYKDASSSKGSFSIWKNAFKTWNKYKDTCHVYNNSGKQLD